MANTDDNGIDGNTETVSQHRRWIGDMSNVLPEFDPIKSIITIDQWIDKIEEYAIMYEWDDVSVQHFALSKLTGVAKLWRDSLPRAERTWIDWVQLLKDNFPTTSVEDIVKIKLEAQNYTRKAGQNVIEYFYEKISRCNRANMDDNETIRWVVRGLGNDRYRDYLGPLERYKRPPELLSHLISASEYIKDKNEKEVSANNDKNTVTNKERSANNQNATKSTVICFRCRTAGHTTKNCKSKTTSQITCFRCTKVGHKANECKSTVTSEHNNITTSSTTGKQQKSAVLQVANSTVQEKYFKNAIVKDTCVRAYIDMGASCVAMKESEVNKLKITYDAEVCDEFIGYGFGRVKTLGRFETVISIDGVSACVMVNVVPDDVQEIALLVGHPFTEQPHVKITSMVGKLKVEEIIPSDAANLVSKTPMWANDAVVIPKNHVGHISVNTNFYNEDLCIEGGIRATQQMVPRCLVSTDARGCAIIPVLNLSDSDYMVKKGDTVTRGVMFTESDIAPKAEREVNTEAVQSQEIKSDIDIDEVERVRDLLNEHKGLIARNLRQVGCTNLAEMKLVLKDDKPIVYRPYRLSYYERERVRNMVDELKNANIVEDSNSEYASPILLVKKKTGDVRMCVDYRAINKITVPDKYPLPRIDDQIDRLHGNTYFTSLDLFSGYYQVPINDPDTRAKLSFVTPDGKYTFKRMPFGPTNCPAIFSRMINTALGKLLYSVALAYLDDIIIPSKDVEEGLHRLKLVLLSLEDAGLTIRLDKCKFFMKKIDYLGFEISGHGVEPGQCKIMAVKHFPVPENVRSVRGFIGLASYFRRFVKNFAIIIKPLTDLLSKNKRYEWGKLQNDAFETIKTLLSSRPILAIYNPDAHTEVHTDACINGIAGVLMQVGSDNKLHPVSYYSRKTSNEESKYHSFELEALAIVCSLERFRVYIIGIHFIIKTDCNSLKLLAEKKDLSPRVGRWFMKLSEFNYTIEYIRGDKHLVPDALSRGPVESASDTEVASLHVFNIRITTDWVAALQRSDKEVSNIITKIEAKDPTVENKYIVESGRLYRLTEGRWRLFLPEELRYDAVSITHRELSHLGIDKTLNKVKECFYFPKMRDFVTKYINRCVNCMFYKTPKIGDVYWHPLDKGNEPFHTVHLDHLGPFVLTERDNKYVLTIVDGFSKYVVLKAVKDVTAVETVNCVLEFLCNYGKPTRLITDRGTAFTASEFERFCRNHNMMHVKVSSKSPRSNGQAEIINGIVVRCLAMTTEDEENKDWDLKLMEVQWSLNNSENRITKTKPFEIIHKYTAEGPVNNPLAAEIAKLNERKNTSVKNINPAELLKQNRLKEEKKISSRITTPTKYQKGDLVLVKWEAPATGQSRKLEPKYKGPYQVRRELRFDRYVVSDISGEQVGRRPFSSVVGFDRLKLIKRI